MEFLSRVLAGLYLALPPLTAGLIAWRHRRSPQPQYARAAAGFVFTCVAGMIIGVGLTLIYAHAIQGHAPLVQLALASYVAVGVICLLKGFSWLLKEGTERALRVRVAPAERGGAWVARTTTALTLRVILLFVIGLPYIMAVAMVYRPKIETADTPQKQLGFKYQPVRFTATDGVPIDGWWIPAISITSPGETPAFTPGERTVILCHGLGANKANQLALARELVPHGYNVIAFDFRAHGSSGGQISSFGALERRDVLGAVRWVRASHPQQSKQVLGLGISMGGAALLAASAEPTAEGRAIDKVAVYDTYDDLSSLVTSITARHPFSPPLAWLTKCVALPLAGAHAGADLAHFSPAVEADALAPRPLLVIHARGDDVIDFEHGVRLYDRASQPKLRFWIGKDDKHGRFLDRQGNPADHNAIIFNDDAANAVRWFFDESDSIL
jgi:alpha-beta hydrolase superfamily lysophospholipase